MERQGGKMERQGGKMENQGGVETIDQASQTLDLDFLPWCSWRQQESRQVN
jgi:hypothetical protein